jgi:hypothetical protein
VAHGGTQMIRLRGMNTRPLQFLILSVAGWVNRRQQDVIEYLQEENRILREHVGDRRLQSTDTERQSLATKARKLSRCVFRTIPAGDSGGLRPPRRGKP